MSTRIFVLSALLVLALGMIGCDEFGAELALRKAMPTRRKVNWIKPSLITTMRLSSTPVRLMPQLSRKRSQPAREGRSSYRR